MSVRPKSILQEEVEEALREQEEEEAEVVEIFAIIVDLEGIYPMNAQKNNPIIRAIFANKKDIKVMIVQRQRVETLILK